jgi:hypothetical protein
MSSFSTSTDSPTDPFLPKYPPREKARPISRARVFYVAAALTIASWATITFLLPSTQYITNVVPYFNATIERIELGEERWTLVPPTQPLTPTALAGTCNQLHHHSNTHHGYYYVDPAFVDPAPKGCKTLTYFLTPGHGLSESLLEVFTSFSLAQRENRTFYIDDTQWSWGKWSDYFTLPMQAESCPRPKPEHQLPCPRSAQHLVVAHETRSHIFGHSFVEKFELGNKMGIERWREIYMMVKDGAAEFEPVEAVLWRGRELEEGVTAVQVRRGALKIKTSAWKNTGRIPGEAYIEAASTVGRKVVLMTDDAGVYEESAFSTAVPAVLGEEAGIVMNGGWTPKGLEGLGREERVSVGRRLLAELLVAGTAEEVVCAGGSATCRLLAVLMGWERAIEDEGWVDVDGGFPWRGIDW